MRKDLSMGFINVSQEDIDKFDLNIEDWTQSDNRAYIYATLARIQQQYAISDATLDKAIEVNPNTAIGLGLFKKIAHSWLKQVVEKYGAVRITAYAIIIGSVIYFPFGLYRALNFDYSNVPTS